MHGGVHVLIVYRLQVESNSLWINSSLLAVCSRLVDWRGSLLASMLNRHCADRMSRIGMVAGIFSGDL